MPWAILDKDKTWCCHFIFVSGRYLAVNRRREGRPSNVWPGISCPSPRAVLNLFDLNHFKRILRKANWTERWKTNTRHSERKRYYRMFSHHFKFRSKINNSIPVQSCLAAKLHSCNNRLNKSMCGNEQWLVSNLFHRRLDMVQCCRFLNPWGPIRTPSSVGSPVDKSGSTVQLQKILTGPQPTHQTPYYRIKILVLYQTIPLFVFLAVYVVQFQSCLCGEI